MVAKYDMCLWVYAFIVSYSFRGLSKIITWFSCKFFILELVLGLHQNSQNLWSFIVKIINKSFTWLQGKFYGHENKV